MKQRRKKLLLSGLSDDLIVRLDAIVPLLDPDRQSRNAVIRLAIRRLVEETERKLQAKEERR